MHLLSFKFEANQLKHAWDIAFFLKFAKRNKRKCDEHKTNFEGAYLHDDWEYLSQT